MEQCTLISRSLPAPTEELTNEESPPPKPKIKARAKSKARVKAEVKIEREPEI